MHIASGSGRSFWQQIASSHVTLQMLLLAPTSYFGPLLSPLLLSGSISKASPSTPVSQTASLFAAVSAVLIFRRVSAYPGVRAFSTILPAFSTTFGIAVTLLLLLRLPYSGSMLIVGYAASVGMCFFASFLERKGGQRQIHFVPAGRIEVVNEVDHMSWVAIARPVIPQSVNLSIMADLHFDLPPEWERMLAEAAISGIPVYHSKQLRESLTGRVQIEHLSENSFGSLVPGYAYLGFKRVIDVASSILLLPLLLPILLLVGSAVRFTSPGPVIFRQTRMGHRGQPFTMFKFRTMVHESRFSEAGDVRRKAITGVGDSRITKVGRFLRKSRIDEFPQILNILRGEMSWIGPRPEAVSLSEWYESEIPFYRYRHIVRPGISGWAQVNQGHVAEVDDVNVKLHYDFYYIKNFSFWLDALIAIRTLRIMMTGFGAK